jgi:hypothetical protein
MAPLNKKSPLFEWAFFISNMINFLNFDEIYY